MKQIIGLAILFFSMIGTSFAVEQVKELSKGSVPATHVSVFCISGYTFASAAFCGSTGCGITMVQVMGKGNQPVACK